MRLSTKSDRLNIRSAEIERLIKYGYKREDYKGLIILTQDSKDDFLLKIYKDTAAHAIIFEKYRDIERRNKRIEGVKRNYDLRETRKAEEKKNKTASTAANASSAIKAELKAEFPNVKFSVRSSNYAGGDSVHIDWEDGPTVSDVENITSKYQYGSFNGMEDMYENTNVRKDIPQTKYVLESRSMSDTLRQILTPDAEKYFNEGWGGSCYDVNNMLYRIFSATTVPNGAVVNGLKRNDVTSGVSTPENFIVFDMELSDVTQETKAPVIEKVEVEPGKVQVIQYSEKSIAVIGDTKPIKDKLKELGGTFNFRLSCGAGWIFPISKLEAIQTAFTN